MSDIQTSNMFRKIPTTQSFLEVVVRHLAHWGERRDEETMRNERRGQRMRGEGREGDDERREETKEGEGEERQVKREVWGGGMG